MDQVWSNYKEALDEVEEQIKKGLDSEVTLINKVAYHILSSGGKRIRPLLLIISAQLCQSVDKRHIHLAGMVEFIHTATLLHDDVLDNAEVRRGIPAARLLWGNQASILVGDYLYTLAVCQAVKMENFEINYLLSTTCRRMSEGETLQLVHSRDLDLTEATYLQIIEYKTAALLSAACKLGGIIGNESDEKKEALSRYGRNLGIAFQVADDTLDYVADRARLGKSPGKDIKEGKVTLPLLHLLQHCSSKDKRELKKVIKKAALLKRDLSFVTGLMEQYGSIAYARKKAQDYANRAKSDLSIFSDSLHRQALCTVADYVVRRDH
ncbi:polyprenyl synthetase family protein [Candidatus Manganitrophus noduliformans]|uniref:Polyprenyl synthetase family protein n=1 Tax=Candidatus Manganitrophus noduliformans TaxID=2606439 RepID=A0A7X6DMK8_9BACT|nr:polyprenyl synthetase family protein [Candidatus Manganitrophus noduliformans]NKE69930.1 polyprenyl synthetase family protein [Candidatus Manganitrophus noduliformans]